MKVLALICVRNEELHISRCLDEWINNGCDVVLIDNDSEDQTVEIARSYMGQGLLAIERLPWKGYFSLKDQLIFKNNIIRQTRHDWVVHADADEVLRGPWSGLSLTTAIQRVDAEGYTCINFREMVFVPWSGQDFRNSDYPRCMDAYYFFEPCYPRLLRAWRRDLAADNIESGGHLLTGAGLNLCPHDFFLCHYIALSFEHACGKYVGRQFDPSEIVMGWHGNRLGIQADQLVLKPSPFLKRLRRWDSVDFDCTMPSTKHYWQWHDCR
jgi:glycosyltransferase involved in cell wall biosynthesis